LNAYIKYENNKDLDKELIDSKIIHYFKEVFNYRQQIEKFLTKFEKEENIDEKLYNSLKIDLDTTFFNYYDCLNEVFFKNIINNEFTVYDFLNKNKNNLIKQIEIKFSKIIRLFEEKIKKMSMDKFSILISYFYILIDYITVKITIDDNFHKTNLIKINVDCIIIEYNDLLLKKSVYKLRNDLSNDSFNKVTIDYSKYVIILKIDIQLLSIIP